MDLLVSDKTYFAFTEETDVFNEDRGSLLKAIPKIIHVNKMLWDEKLSNQSSLFSSKSEKDQTILKLEPNEKLSKKDLSNIWQNLSQIHLSL